MSALRLGWSNDGEFILYRPSIAPEAKNGVLFVEVKTGASQLLSRYRALSGTFSPNNQEILIDHQIFAGLNNWGQVWHINRVDNTKTLLFRDGGFIAGLTWSPDGQQVAYIGGCSEEGGIEVQTEPGESVLRSGGLCLINPYRTNRRLVTLKFVIGYGFYPIWSPDSRHLAFVTLDGPPPTKPDEDRPPWNPPWNEMAFVNTNIYVLDTQTGEEWPRLDDGLTGHIDPAWSSDGSQLIFASQRSGQPEIWAANINRAGLQQLTFDGQMKRHPLWHPSA